MIPLKKPVAKLCTQEASAASSSHERSSGLCEQKPASPLYNRTECPAQAALQSVEGLAKANLGYTKPTPMSHLIVSREAICAETSIAWAMLSPRIGCVDITDAALTWVAILSRLPLQYYVSSILQAAVIHYCSCNRVSMICKQSHPCRSPRLHSSEGKHPSATAQPASSAQPGRACKHAAFLYPCRRRHSYIPRPCAGCQCGQGAGHFMLAIWQEP